MLIFERRASAIIYNFLKSNKINKIFILPANICPIVPITFLKAGVKFEFVDIDLNTFCINKKKVINKIKNNPDLYDGLIYVRTYGFIENTQDLFKTIKNIDENFIIIDDRCLCPPNFGIENIDQDIIIYSTGYGKFVDIDFGGYAILKKNLNYFHNKLDFDKNELNIIEGKYKDCIKMNTKFNYENNKWLDNRKVEMNFNVYKQKILNEKEKIIKHKNEINKLYSKELPLNIQLDMKFQGWRFNIKVPNKEKILRKIFNAGLFASSHYSSLGLIFDNKKCNNASRLHKHMINLFNDKYFNLEKAEKIIDIINKCSK